jgi:hypothetical protein
MRKIRITNEKNRDATVGYQSPKPDLAPTLGLASEAVTFRRYLSSASPGLHDALAAVHGADYGRALVEGDPDVDIEVVGRTLGPTDNVFLDHEGNVLFAPPEIVEVLLAPDGSEQERREPVNTVGNVNETEPLRWTKMRFKRMELIRKFAIRRTIQIKHVDGLSYDFLYSMAKDLDQTGEVVHIGAGSKGRDALVFSDNGSPYRGFLEGRTDGLRYQLLLHLSSLELKVPKEVS